MSTFDLQLPDGTILQGIPEGTTKDEIKAKIGLDKNANEEDFDWAKALIPNPVEDFKNISNLIPAAGEAINYVTGDATKGVGTNFMSGIQKPIIGATQDILDEADPRQAKLAALAEDNQKNIDKSGIIAGTIPALVGEGALWLVPGGALRKAGGKLAAKIFPNMLKSAADIYKGSRLAQGAANAAALSAAGAADVAITPVTGRTQEARAAQQAEQGPEAMLEGARNTAMLGFGLGVTGAVLGKSWRWLQSLRKDGTGDGAILDSLADRVNKKLKQDINVTRKDFGEGPVNLSDTKAALVDSQSKLDKLNAETGQDFMDSSLSSMDDAGVAKFFKDEYGEEVAQTLSRVSDNNAKKAAKLIDLARQGDEEATSLVSDIAATVSRSPEEHKDIVSKFLGAKEGITDSITPQSESLLSSGAFAKGAQNIAENNAAVSTAYNKFADDIAPLDFDVKAINNSVKKYLADIPAINERKKAKAILNAILPLKAGKVTGADINAARRDGIEEYLKPHPITNKATDAVAVRTKNFLNKNLLDDSLTAMGRQDLVKARRAADDAKIAFEKRFTSPVSEDVMQQVDPMQKLRNVGENKDPRVDNWTSSVFRSPENVQKTLKEIPEVTKEVNGAFIAKLAKLADDTGSIKKSKLGDFLLNPDNQSILNLPEMAEAKAAATAMQNQAAKSDTIRVGEALRDYLGDDNLMQGLWAGAKLADKQSVIRLAKEAGHIETLKKAASKGLYTKIVKETPDGLVLDMNKTAKSILEGGNERKIFEDIYGPEDSSTIFRGLKLLKKSQDELNTFFKAANERPVLQQAAEAGASIGGQASVGAASRVGDVLRKLGPTRPQSVVRMLLKDPKMMAKFIERVEKRQEAPSHALVNVLQTWNIITSGDTPSANLYTGDEPLEGGFLDNAGAPNTGVTNDSTPDAQDTKYKYSIKVEPLVSVWDALDKPELLGKASAPAEEDAIAPEHSLDVPVDTKASVGNTVGTSVQKSVASVADEVSKRAGVPKNFLKVMLGIESGLGKLAPNNPGQIQGPAWSDMVKKYGRKYGITEGMKTNTKANVIMSAHYLADQATSVSRKLGRKAQPWEVYMSYNMGPENYNRFVKLMKEKKSTPVASALVSRKHAEGNAPFFFDNKKPNGKALNYKQVAQRYKEFFDKKTKEFSQFLS